jgi:MIP family channel proteins
MFSGWTDRRAVAPVVAELAGTFLFFFVGIGAVATIDRVAQANGTIDFGGALVVIALASGIALAVLASALGAISGGHLNPAVTFGVWLAGKMPWQRGLAYAIAQLIGGLLAAWSLRLVFPATVSPALGTPTLSAGVDPVAGVLIETVITLILVAVLFGTVIDPRAPRIGGLGYGLALVAGILMAGPLTGGAANPARWFGPAAVTGVWDSWYVWIIGPLLGGGIAGLAHRYLFSQEASSTPA